MLDKKNNTNRKFCNRLILLLVTLNSPHEKKNGQGDAMSLQLSIWANRNEILLDLCWRTKGIIRVFRG